MRSDDETGERSWLSTVQWLLAVGSHGASGGGAFGMVREALQKENPWSGLER